MFQLEPIDKQRYISSTIRRQNETIILTGSPIKCTVRFHGSTCVDIDRHLHQYFFTITTKFKRNPFGIWIY